MRTGPYVLFILLICLCDFPSSINLFASEFSTLSPPRNDDFAHRRRISGDRVTVHGTTLGATIESAESPYDRNSVWFSWTAPRDHTFELNLSAGSTVAITAFTGTQVGALTSKTDSSSHVVLRTKRGQRYSIRVNSTYQDDSDFTLKIRPVVSPANDDFVNAIAFTGTNIAIHGTVRYATQDSGGPVDVAGNGNVWYRWEAPNDGLFLASTASEGNAIYPSIFHGTNSLDLTSIGQSVAGLKSGSAFYATNGGIYWISANGSSAFSSNFNLSVSAETPPPNDDFENSTVVVGAEVSIVGSSLGATFAPGEPGYVFPRPPPLPSTPLPPTPGPPQISRASSVVFLNPSPLGGYVWYSWTAPTTGVYRISANLISSPPDNPALGGSLFRADVLVILSGNSLPDLTQVASGYSHIGAVLRATAGVTYRIAIPAGKFSFQFEIKPVQSPPNDDYADATVITGAFVSELGSTMDATPEPSSPYSDAAVWYRWTAPSNGFFAVTVLPPTHNLSIYSGDDFITAQLLAWQDARPVLRTTAGQEFRIAVAQTYSVSNNFVLNIEPVTPPANDDFENSEMLTGTNVSFIARVQNSTREENEPGTAWAAARDTVWYSWIAPADGQYEIRFLTNTAYLKVYTGTNFWTLNYLSGNSGLFGLLADRVFFGAQAGTLYHFSVDDVLGYASDLPLNFRMLPRPSNDNFAGGLRLKGANVTVRGTLAGATIEPEELHFTGDTGQSVWYWWTAPRSQQTHFETDASLVLIFTGDSISNRAYVGGGNRFDLPVTAGETYRVAVMGNVVAEPMEFELRIRSFHTPSNDAFENRKRIVARARGTTSGASREEEEPGYELDPTGASVWWKWRAPRDGVYELELTSEFAMAKLYTGERLEDLEPVVSTSDDGRLLHFRATKGTFYGIEISNPTGLSGNYQFRIVRRNAPANDDFARRIELVGTNIIVTGSNAFATPEPDEPGHGFEGAQHSVWWKWTPPANGAVFIQFDGSMVKRAGIYTGESLDDLESIAEGNGNFYFDVIGGEELQIGVDDSYFGYNAEDPWQFRLLFVPAPLNDNFAARTSLTGTNVHVTGSFVGASSEIGEPFLFYNDNHSVWWSWTAPETGSYTFRLHATNLDPNLSLYSGSTLNDLEAVAPAEIFYPVSEVNVPLTAGEEVAIRTDGPFEMASDQFEFTITKVPAAPNDNFAQRADLIDGRGVGNNEGATGETGEWGAYDSHFNSIWWRFTAVSNGLHTLVAWVTNRTGEARTIEQALLTGDSVTNLSSVPLDEWHLDRRYLLTAGTDYSIQVSDSSFRFGIVSVEVRHVPSPANDHFTNATQLIGEHVSIIGSNAWSTPEWNEPFGYAGNSVWWRWVPESNGVYLLTVNPTYSSQYLDVFTGTSLTNLTLVPAVAYGAQYPASLFRARGGVEYFIRLTSHPVSEAQFTLGLNRVQPPANDDFTNRTLIVGEHISLTFSNSFATPEPGDPLVDFISQQTVWWKWVAPTSGRAYVTLTNSPYMRMDVFAGTELTNLVSVLDSPSGSFPKTFNAQAGAEYQIGATTVSSYAAENFTLLLDFDSSISMTPAGSIQDRRLVLSLKANQIVETSIDLVSWTAYGTNVTIAPNPEEPQRFFRVR